MVWHNEICWLKKRSRMYISLLRKSRILYKSRISNWLFFVIHFNHILFVILFLFILFKKTSGNITRISNKNYIINTVKGSWLEYLEFDNKRYWDIQLISPVNLLSTLDPLPSDSRYREDLVFLAQKNINESQEYIFLFKYFIKNN